jgi:tripeptidyl-peptidase-1
MNFLHQITCVHHLIDFQLHFHKLPHVKSLLDESHEVIFAVKRDNLDVLEARLEEISDPFSSRYGQHLSKEEINSYTNSQPRYEKIRRHLEQHGIEMSAHPTCCDYLRATSTIRRWESFFQTKFHAYSAISPYFPVAYRKRKQFRTTSAFTIPAEIMGDVEHIFHVKEFAPPMAPSVAIRDVAIPVTASPGIEALKTSLRGFRSDQHPALNSIANEWLDVIDGFVSPNLLNQLYDIRSNDGNNLTNQCTYQGGSWFSAADLVQFQNYFSLPMETVALDIGQAQNDSLCRTNAGVCGEANLDVQYIMAVARHVPTIMYEWGDGSGTLDPWLAWILQVSNMTDSAPPDVISISYVSYEFQFDHTYARSFATEAMLLGLQGVSIIVASGDDGVVGYFLKHGQITCGYYPMFPASCPYVTAIGGTTGPEYGRDDEIVCSAEKDKVFITSGGGFSNLYRTPSWQKSHVAGYLVQTTPPVGTGSSPFNASGRGYPDISAIGNNYLVVLNGQLVSVSGTSASSPVIAGMISLINAERLAHNASRLGWINPLLYARNLSALWTKDVVYGNNSCSAVAGLCCAEGFPAAPGWDPSTGLGVLNFSTFRDVALGLVDITSMKTWAPSYQPTMLPTVPPTRIPTALPTSARPSIAPSTSMPTVTPTRTPTYVPSFVPSVVPSIEPTSNRPSVTPTWAPTEWPTSRPTTRPTISHAPSYLPTLTPTLEPTEEPTVSPSTVTPSRMPTMIPSMSPTAVPTFSPTQTPTQFFQTQQITFQVEHTIAPFDSDAVPSLQSLVDAGVLRNLLANLTCTQLFNNSLAAVEEGDAHCTVHGEVLRAEVLLVPTPEPTPLPSTLAPVPVPSSPSPTSTPTSQATPPLDIRHHLRQKWPIESGTTTTPRITVATRRPSTEISTISKSSKKNRRSAQGGPEAEDETIFEYVCTVDVRVALATLVAYLPADYPLVRMLSDTSSGAEIAQFVQAQLPSLVSNLTALSVSKAHASTGEANILSFITNLNPSLFASVDSIGFADVVPNSLAVSNVPSIVFAPSKLPTTAPSNAPANSLIEETVPKSLWNRPVMLIVVVLGSITITTMCTLLMYSCCCYQAPYDEDEAVAGAADKRPGGGGTGTTTGGRANQMPDFNPRHRGRVADEHNLMVAMQLSQEEAESQDAIAAVIAAERAERKAQKQSSQRKSRRGMHPLLRSTMISPFMTEEERRQAEQQRQAYIEYQQRRRAARREQREQARSQQQKQQQQQQRNLPSQAEQAPSQAAGTRSRGHQHHHGNRHQYQQQQQQPRSNNQRTGENPPSGNHATSVIPVAGSQVLSVVPVASSIDNFATAENAVF